MPLQALYIITDFLMLDGVVSRPSLVLLFRTSEPETCCGPSKAAAYST